MYMCALEFDKKKNTAFFTLLRLLTAFIFFPIFDKLTQSIGIHESLVPFENEQNWTISSGVR